MPEPLSPEYLRQVQDRIMATRPGPWPIAPDDAGLPAGFGPFSFVEAWQDDERTPAIDFCSQARTDIPRLLGEIARLKTELALIQGARVPRQTRGGEHL
ncbi:hypothetical protein OG393_30720 [Streptomyces sp. NBC_01216]|uniref:hypothetical protein n=1 Tax=Streptomyces sp. NBC_01216 TaxID=2903778 RepID=UPI002E11EDE7|nr:hypothetical protein OG393_30720 [Streptomyces sp. NBC_01216]